MPAELTLVLVADATYTFTSPLDPTENEAGSYAVVGTTLTLSQTGTGSPKPFMISRDGNTMTLTGLDTWDFASGVEEAATLVIPLMR